MSDTTQTNTPPQAVIDLLNNVGADTLDHRANRHLLEHLLSTYNLLSGWGHDAPVAVGGLLHSIYSTSAFEVACLAPTERDKVRTAAGNEAENLAYLFSAMDRTDFLNRLGTNKMLDRFENKDIDISKDETRHMCEILFANELDLAIAKKGADRPDKIEKKLAPCFEQLKAFLTPSAHTAYFDAIKTRSRT